MDATLLVQSTDPALVEAAVKAVTSAVPAGTVVIGRAAGARILRVTAPGPRSSGFDPSSNRSPTLPSGGSLFGPPSSMFGAIDGGPVEAPDPERGSTLFDHQDAWSPTPKTAPTTELVPTEAPISGEPTAPVGTRFGPGAGRSPATTAAPSRTRVERTTARPVSAIEDAARTLRRFVGDEVPEGVLLRVVRERLHTSKNPTAGLKDVCSLVKQYGSHDPTVMDGYRMLDHALPRLDESQALKVLRSVLWVDA